MTWQVRYPHDESPEWREIGDEVEAIARLHFGPHADAALGGDEWRVEGAEFRRKESDCNEQREAQA